MEIHEVKIMALRRDGECLCGAFVPRGAQAGWHRSLRRVICASCLKLDGPPPTVDTGVPGASLQREYERRTAARALRVMTKHPRVGRMLLRLAGQVRTTTAFATGAEGEREAAEVLSRKVGDSVLFLYNRRIGVGRERGDIDIIAVAPSGVCVIDPKKYVGRKVRANRAGDGFLIDGRRRPALATGMRRHLNAMVAGVRSGPVPEAPVFAAYCFIGADLPWRRLVIDGVPALGLRGTVELLKRPGPLSAEQRTTLRDDLARRFPTA